MAGCAESSVAFESGGYLLRGIVHQPIQEPPAAGLLFVHPFAEEKKCSHRVFVEAARAAVNLGCAVLRFDFRGCGDSEGQFEASDLEAWRQDLRQAFAFARSNLGAKQVGLLGLRLGGTLAAELAEEELELACLLLWEPVVEGARYLSLTMRQSMLRKRLTVHEGGSELEAEEPAGDKDTEIDFDGYLVPAQTRQQIAQVDLLAEPKAYPGPVLVLNLSGRPKVAPALEKLASLYVSGEAQVVRQEPIWSTVGLIDPAPTVTASMEWLRRALRPKGLDTQPS